MSVEKINDITKRIDSEIATLSKLIASKQDILKGKEDELAQLLNCPIDKIGEESKVIINKIKSMEETLTTLYKKANMILDSFEGD